MIVTDPAHAIAPSPRLLLEISQNHAGALCDVPFALLLRAMSEHDRSGIIELHRGPIYKRVLFEAGRPVQCESNLVHERLGRYLVANGTLSEMELASCLSASLREGKELGQIVLARQHVGASELYRVLQKSLARKLLDLFSWYDGEYELSSHTASVASPIKVRVHQLILTGLTRFVSAKQIECMSRAMAGEKLCLHPAPPTDPVSMRLSRSQRKVLKRLREGPCEMSHLANDAKLGGDELSRIVFAYLLLGFVTPESQVVELALATTAPAEAGRPEQVPRPADATNQQTALELQPFPDDELLQMYRDHRGQDAFELLGLPDDATRRVCEITYFSFACRLNPWFYPADGGRREQAGELFLAAARAYSVLTDPAQRSNLESRRRRARDNGETPQSPSNNPRITTDLLVDPEVQYGRGKAFAHDGKFLEALELFELASDSDPQNGLYRSEAAYCLYLSSPREAETALANLADARRIDTTCGEAWFYAGQILSDRGEFEEAERMLQAAIRPMAPDRRPIEALKQLKQQLSKRT